MRCPIGSSAERFLYAAFAARHSYTRRFNTRHKQWGRLFGDRYKSILIDDDHKSGGSSYLASLLDYVHLNPARADIVAPGKKHADSVLDYPWSSIKRGYALAPKKRPQWLVADAGLELFGLKHGKSHSIRKAAYGDLSVVATAWAICRNTSVPQRWIAERLSLGSRANVSERVRKFGQIETANLSKEMRRWKAMKF